jgi:nucleotide-binding universal stress UspA family protein
VGEGLEAWVEEVDDLGKEDTWVHRKEDDRSQVAGEVGDNMEEGRNQAVGEVDGEAEDHGIRASREKIQVSVEAGRYDAEKILDRMMEVKHHLGKEHAMVPVAHQHKETEDTLDHGMARQRQE